MDGLAPTSVDPGKPEGTPEPPRTTINVGGVDYDLQNCFPIDLSDWEALDAIGVMSRKGDVELASPKMIIDTLTHFVQKLNPELTRADVGKVHLRDLPNMAKILELLVDREEAAYRKNPTQGGSST